MPSPPSPKALTLIPKPQQLLLFVSKQLHFQSSSKFSPVPYSFESRFFRARSPCTPSSVMVPCRAGPGSSKCGTLGVSGQTRSAGLAHPSFVTHARSCARCLVSESNCPGRFCQRIKTCNRRGTHGRTDYVNLYIRFTLSVCASLRRDGSTF